MKNKKKTKQNKYNIKQELTKQGRQEQNQIEMDKELSHKQKQVTKISKRNWKENEMKKN